MIFLTTFHNNTPFIFAPGCMKLTDIFQVLIQQLCEKCFLLFNNHLFVMALFALTIYVHRIILWICRCFYGEHYRPQTRYDRDFIFFAIFSDPHKQQVSYSYQHRRVGQKLDLAALLGLQRIFTKWDTIKIMPHKTAVFLQIMVPFDLWYVICCESYSQSKLVSFLDNPVCTDNGQPLQSGQIWTRPASLVIDEKCRPI